MKPECRHAVESIAALSAEDLTPAEAELVRKHLEDCPPCKGQWVLFERSMTLLTGTSRATLETKRSRQMWLVCMEHARQQQTGHPQVQGTKSIQLSGAIYDEVGDNPKNFLAPLTSERTLPAGWGWLASPVRTGWALAGGAAAVLMAAYFLAPQAPEVAGPLITKASLPPMPMNSGGDLVEFQKPPRTLTPFLGHHASLSFEPYGDHVGPAVISHSAAYSAARP